MRNGRSMWCPIEWNGFRDGRLGPGLIRQGEAQSNASHRKRDARDQARNLRQHLAFGAVQEPGFGLYRPVRAVQAQSRMLFANPRIAQQKIRIRVCANAPLLAKQGQCRALVQATQDS